MGIYYVQEWPWNQFGKGSLFNICYEDIWIAIWEEEEEKKRESYFTPLKLTPNVLTFKYNLVRETYYSPGNI